MAHPGLTLRVARRWNTRAHTGVHTPGVWEDEEGCFVFACVCACVHVGLSTHQQCTCLYPCHFAGYSTSWDVYAVVSRAEGTLGAVTHQPGIHHCPLLAWRAPALPLGPSCTNPSSRSASRPLRADLPPTPTHIQRGRSAENSQQRESPRRAGSWSNVRSQSWQRPSPSSSFPQCHGPPASPA